MLPDNAAGPTRLPRVQARVPFNAAGESKERPSGATEGKE